jgi:hypothetical protein
MKVVMAKSKALSWYLTRGAVKNHEKPHSQLTFKLGTTMNTGQKCYHLSKFV